MIACFRKIDRHHHFLVVGGSPKKAEIGFSSDVEPEGGDPLISAVCREYFRRYFVAYSSPIFLL